MAKSKSKNPSAKNYSKNSSESKKSVNAERIVSSDNSDSESSDSDNIASQAKDTSKPIRTAAADLSEVTDTSTSSQSDSDSESESEDSSEDAGDESSDERSDVNAKTVKSKGTSLPRYFRCVPIQRGVESSQTYSSTLDDAVPARPYEPPNGYKVIQDHTATSQQSHKLLNKSNLAGKQLWHISAPANVSVKDVKELSLAKIAKGESILNTGGVDYGLSKVDSVEQKIALLIPESNGYVKAPVIISNSFKLQQVLSLPKLCKSKDRRAENGVDLVASGVRPIKSARPQPKGLRMRFKPSGFGNEDTGIIGSSDSEGELASTPRHTSKQSMILPPGYTPEKVAAIKASASQQANSMNGQSMTKEQRKQKKRKERDGQDEKPKKKKRHHDKEAKAE